MWIRSALWEGSINPGKENEFKTKINEDFLPQIKAMPGVKDVKALWPRVYEDRSKELFCQIIVEFEGEKDIQTMLASPQRHATRARLSELGHLYQGKISHINYEVYK